MSDPYFFCYRCKQHKAHRLLSSRTSPSGKPCCVSCESKLQKGVSTSKAPEAIIESQRRPLSGYIQIEANMKLTIYMKSGNVITARGVRAWDGQYSGNTITKLHISRYRRIPFLSSSASLWVSTLDLSQIEAIVETKYFSLW